MIKNNDNNKKNYHLPIWIGIGLIFGVIFDQIPTGLCLGIAIGLGLDGNKKKK